jgi:hypothetical protein
MHAAHIQNLQTCPGHEPVFSLLLFISATGGACQSVARWRMQHCSFISQGGVGIPAVDPVNREREQDFVHMKTWLRTESAMAFHLTNGLLQVHPPCKFAGVHVRTLEEHARNVAMKQREPWNICYTVQINFFDHTKLMVSALTGLVTYIDEKGLCNTYNACDVDKYAASRDCAHNIKWAVGLFGCSGHHTVDFSHPPNACTHRLSLPALHSRCKYANRIVDYLLGADQPSLGAGGTERS